MLVHLILDIIETAAGALFSILPKIETLPNILGVDIDATLITGVGAFKAFITAIWPIQIVFEGLLFLLVYYILKNSLRLLLGHRTPVAN